MLQINRETFKRLLIKKLKLKNTQSYKYAQTRIPYTYRQVHDDKQSTFKTIVMFSDSYGLQQKGHQCSLSFDKFCEEKPSCGCCST